MNQTVRWIGVGVVFVLCWGVAGAQAQQRPVAAEPQTPGRTVQAPSELVPALPVPRLVKFAGTFKDEQGRPRTGVVGVTFALYKEQEGGAALWLETQNVELDEQGHYTALLGATRNEGLPLELFSSGEPRWLGVQVNLPKELEQQRVLLVSVPYALKAADAETLGGKPLSSFVLVQEAGEPSASGTAASGRGKVQASTAPGIDAVGPIVGLGTVNQVAKFTPDGLTIGDAAITEVGGKVGIGTGSPQAALDVQLTTGSPTNAVNSTITLNNSAPITGSVLSAFNMTLVDKSTAANLSKQPARFIYLRDAAATGGVLAFDAVMTATAFLSADAPYQLRGMNIEGPTIIAGKTLGNFTGLYIGSPGGGGTVTTANALVTEPNAGNVGIGTTAPGQKLEVAGNVKVSGLGNAIIFPDNTVMSTATLGVGGGTITGVTAGAGLTGGGTVGGVTLNVNATPVNTGGTIVSRDVAGGFAAGTITGNLSGNATTATSFTGSLAGEVTGTQGATVVSNAVSASTANAIVRRDGAGGFAAGNLTLSGNLALPHTTSATAGVITLGGVPFAHDFGANNTFVGALAGNTSLTGGDNAAFGRRALRFNTTGTFNTAVGVNALVFNTTGRFNTAVGVDADVSFGNLTNATAIGAGALADDSNQIRLGNDLVTLVKISGDVRVGVPTMFGCITNGIGSLVIAGTCVSDARLKKDIRPFDPILEKLAQLQPVHFRWKAKEYPDLHLGSGESFGLIAQEVEKSMPEMVTEDSKGYKRIHYSMLPLLLLQAFKEQQSIIQSQQEEIEALKAALKSLAALDVAQALEKRTAENADFKARLEELERRMGSYLLATHAK